MTSACSINPSAITTQIDATCQTLNSARQLLENIDSDAYNNRDAAPYHASVGGHIRHILDVYDSTLRGIENRKVDLADRRRDPQIETIPAIALHNLERICQELRTLASLPSKLELTVVDELGNGRVEIPYSLAALLYQAQSHAIHHFACIGYILAHQNIQIPIAGFGYNPTSPKGVKHQMSTNFKTPKGPR